MAEKENKSGAENKAAETKPESHPQRASRGPSPGRIVLVNLAGGKAAPRQPAIVAGVEKDKKTITAHVLPVIEKDGQFYMTQGRTLSEDQKGERAGSWAWPVIE